MRECKQLTLCVCCAVVHAPLVFMMASVCSLCYAMYVPFLDTTHCTQSHMLLCGAHFAVYLCAGVLVPGRLRQSHAQRDIHTQYAVVHSCSLTGVGTNSYAQIRAPHRCAWCPAPTASTKMGPTGP